MRQEANKESRKALKKLEVPKNLQGVKGLKPFPKRIPAVFMFQPTHYKMVSTPEELQMWERMMIEMVGMNPEFFQNRRQVMLARGHESVSGSGGVDGGWDD